MKIKIDGNTMRQAVQELAERDGDLAAFYRQHGLPRLRTRPTGFGTLLKIICGQQVSTAAARAITGRLDIYASPMTPEIFLSLQETDYRAIGLSRQKEVYGRGIAEAVVSGDLNFQENCPYGRRKRHCRNDQAQRGRPLDGRGLFVVRPPAS